MLAIKIKENKKGKKVSKVNIFFFCTYKEMVSKYYQENKEMLQTKGLENY